jgi:uncharacterized caspase-like protein
MPELTTASIQSDPFEALKQGKATLRMFLIGIDGYTYLSSLNFAVADCQGLTRALAESTKGFPSKVSVSIIGDREILSPVTLESIESGFKQLLSGVQPQDTVLIYFSGHGDLDESTEELYLCLTETRHELLSETALSVKKLLQRLKDSGASSQVLILDTCHSGGIVPRSRRAGEVCETVGSPRSIEGEDNPKFTPRLTEILNQHASPSREFCALLSCQATQLSWEFTDLGHGAFTYYLMEGLQSSPETIDRLGRIDVESLYDYVRNHTHDLVLKRRGKQQTPSRIVSGSNKIFVGARNNNRSLEERRNSYREVVRNLLRQFYQPDCPITETVADQLEHIADRESVPPQSKLEIEANEIRDLEDELDLYRRKLSQWLHQSHPQDPERFCCESRISLGFDSRITSSFDATARQEFLVHKNEYCQKFKQYKYEELESYDVVRIYGINFKFSEAVLDYLEEEINEEFIRSRMVYSGQVRHIFRHQINGNIQQIHLLQEEKGFCDRISQEIINEQRQLLEKDKEIYRKGIRELFHGQIEPNLNPLSLLQEDLELGGAIVEEIREQEEVLLKQHCERYRQQCANFFREDEELSPTNQTILKKLAVGLGFNSLTRSIVKEIEEEELESCKQSLAVYRQILTEVILQEGPVNIKANNHLKKAADLSQLSEVWIKACQKEVIEEFSEGQQIYAREYEDKIRNYNSLTEADRVLLRNKQAEFDLGDLVIKTIESIADSNLSRDKEAYQRSFRNYIRQRSITSGVKQNLKQQLDLRLGDEIIVAIEFNENEVLAKDKESYQEAVVNELDRQYPLSVISKQDLKNRQQQLELCDEVSQQIEQEQIDGFEKRKQSRKEYEIIFSDTIRRCNLLSGETLSEDRRSYLDEYYKVHNLDLQDVQAIEQRITIAYKKRLQDYQSTYQQESEDGLIDREMLDLLIEGHVLPIDGKVAKSIEAAVDQDRKLSQPSWQLPLLSIAPLLFLIQTTLYQSKDYVLEQSHQLKKGAIYLLGIGVASGGTIALIHWKASQPPEPIAVPIQLSQFTLFDRQFLEILHDRAIAERLKKAASNNQKDKTNTPPLNKQSETNSLPPPQGEDTPRSVPTQKSTIEEYAPPDPPYESPREEPGRREPVYSDPPIPPESPPEPPKAAPPESTPEKPRRPKTGESTDY